MFLKDPTSPLASYCRISTYAQHTIKTVLINTDMLGWIQSGTKILLGPHQRLVCQSQQLFMLQRGSQWDVINDPAPHHSYRVVVVQIEPEIINEFFDRYSADFPVPPIHPAAIVQPDTEILHSLQRTVEALEQPGRSYALRKHRIVENLLLLAERGYLFPPGNALTWAERIRRLISQRPDADWDAATLAQSFHVSTSTLRRRLMKCGVTTAELVKEVRLETALMLLQSTSLPIGDIAQRCGYASHSRFSKAFQARFGFLPSHLRSRELTVSAQSSTLSG